MALGNEVIAVTAIDRTDSVAMPGELSHRILFGGSIWRADASGALTLVANGSRLLDADKSRTLVWTAGQSGAEVRLISEVGLPTVSVAGTLSIIGAFDGNMVRLADSGRFGSWDPTSGQVAWHPVADRLEPVGIATSADRVVIIDEAGTTTLYDTKTAQAVATWFVAGTSCLAIDPTATQVATCDGGASGQVDVRQLRDGSVAWSASIPDSNVLAVAWPTPGIVWILMAQRGTGTAASVVVATKLARSAPVDVGLPDIAAIHSMGAILQLTDGGGDIVTFDLTGATR